jgi:hypothetical protein
MILKYSIIVFLTQLVFIGCRTWNVKAIAKNNLLHVLLSGAIVHIAWLVSIAIGAVSMHEIVSEFNWKYVPVVICSLAGGLIGSYLGLKERKR